MVFDSRAGKSLLSISMFSGWVSSQVILEEFSVHCLARWPCCLHMKHDTASVKRYIQKDVLSYSILRDSGSLFMSSGCIYI